MQVQLESPLPDGIHAVVQVNLGEPVDIGATEAPPGARLQPLPTTTRRPTQIVVWFRADRLGLRYTSASVAIVYSVDGQEYRVTYPQGVTVCSVRDPVQHPECD